MRNKILLLSGLSILFSLFLSLSMGSSGMDGVHAKTVLEDRTQLHVSGRETGKSDGARPAPLQEAEEGAQKPESNAESGPPAPDNGTTGPKAPEKSGALTPFKPSEEIRADQAVDFPYDI